MTFYSWVLHNFTLLPFSMRLWIFFPFSEIFLTFFAYSTEISTQCFLLCSTFESKTNRNGVKFSQFSNEFLFISLSFFCSIASNGVDRARWIKLKHFKLKDVQFLFAVVRFFFINAREKGELKTFST